MGSIKVMKAPTGKTILSGVQPSGTLHIGNYLGALKQWVGLQKDNSVFYCIVDLHAITVPYEVKQLPTYILDTAAIYFAVGIDPTKSVVFVQSHIPAHVELMWLLATQTWFGELERMTQFKEKAKKNQARPSLGLFAYPVLMAADILLYQADIVPVGEDQVQHVELARDLASRFNKKFGDTFKVPQSFLNAQTSRIMSIADPNRKMSKSDHAKSYIALMDGPEIIRKKIMSAVTETEPIFSFRNSGPAVQNLLHIYESFSEQSRADIEQQFTGYQYKEFKEALTDLIIKKLTPIREKYNKLRQDEQHLRSVLEEGHQKATAVANKTLQDVKEKMGLVV